MHHDELGVFLEAPSTHNNQEALEHWIDQILDSYDAESDLEILKWLKGQLEREWDEFRFES